MFVHKLCRAKVSIEKGKKTPVSGGDTNIQVVFDVVPVANEQNTEHVPLKEKMIGMFKIIANYHCHKTFHRESK